MTPLLAEARARISALADGEDSTAVIDCLVGSRVPLASPTEHRDLVDGLMASLFGLGAMQQFVTDPAVTELMVNRGRELWIERRGRLESVGEVEPAEVAAVVERLLAPLGLRLDRTHPVVDARLADGSRVCVVAPPVAPDGLTLTIRRFGTRRLELADFGDQQFVELMAEVVARRLNVIVSGATSSGKTTLLNVIAAAVGNERVVTIEDTAELRLHTPHVVRLESRPATTDGVGAVHLRDLLRAALRLRPDRLVVGEVRGAEAADLLQALNTGHDGSLGTIHANSAADAIGRLETLVQQSMPTWPVGVIRAQLASAVDVVVHVRRLPDGARSAVEVVEVGGVVDGDVALSTVWSASTGAVAALRRSRR